MVTGELRGLTHPHVPLWRTANTTMATAAPDVAELPARDHQGGHHQCVERDDGLDGRHFGVEVVDQLADRDVHDRGVEHHQELRDAESDQRLPPAHPINGAAPSTALES